MDYENICEVYPDFTKFCDFQMFCYLRYIVSSRVFGFWVNDKKEGGLVPLADMLNHSTNRHVNWSFEDSHNGFVIKSIVDIPENSELYDSYGLKCNSRFFLNYGFIQADNDFSDRTNFIINLNKGIALYDQKLQFFPFMSKSFGVYKNCQFGLDFQDKKVKDSFGY